MTEYDDLNFDGIERDALPLQPKGRGVSLHAELAAFFRQRKKADKRRGEELTRVKQKSLLNSSLSEAAQAVDELSN